MRKTYFIISIFIFLIIFFLLFYMDIPSPSKIINEPYQVEGAMATPGMGGYPSGTAMQMAYTSDYGRDDALRRGGDEDMEDPEVTEEGSALPWVSLPETEKVAKLEAMRKELEEAGDEMPILNALLKVDYA